jgi:glycosyltransferase involved in cell wall biosynthesis
LPKIVESDYATHVKLLSPFSRLSTTSKIDELKNVTFRTIKSPLQPYSTPDIYRRRIEDTLRLKQGTHGGNFGSAFIGGMHYSGNMYDEVHRYAAIAAELAVSEQFDVVHAHDWMTYPAGIAVAAISGKPLIVHVHSTEFDRSGENVNQMIYDIERMGMERADRVIAVSHFTRNIIISRYGISREKVVVVYNSVQRNGNDNWALTESGIKKDEKIVLFLGRITMQLKKSLS